MIIGSYEVDKDKILELQDDPDSMYSYIDSLVPSKYKHIKPITYNQRYYAGTLILSDNDISVETKRKINDVLIKNLHVNGYLGVFISCEKLEEYINMNTVNQYLKGELNEN